MKILLVNKFYYPRGGDCLVAMGMEQMLRKRGYEVAFFAMQYPQNTHSDWQGYFPGEIDFSMGGARGKVAAVKRLLGKDEVVTKFVALMDNFCPDVVHMHNIHSYLSPVVAEIAQKKGAKVVWTLHDYKLICPTYSFLREGKVCELCLTQPTAVVAKKCMKGSLPASLIAFMEARVWNKARLIRHVDAFICPSRFMKEKMMQGGFPETKLTVLNNFLPFLSKDISPRDKQDKTEPAYCYVGRLSEEKGVGQLLDVAAGLPYRLLVAGTGPLADVFEKRYAIHQNIVFLGQQSREQVEALFHEACFSVIPSVWYENNPLSVIESLSLGTPVLGANIGGIPELIEEGRNGLLFEAGNADDLKLKIEAMFESVGSRKFASAGDIQNRAAGTFSEDAFYSCLLEVYSSL